MIIKWLNGDENVEKEMDSDEIIAAVMNNTEDNERRMNPMMIKKKNFS